MATQITKPETVTLQDGTEITVRPLSIKHLRKFMAVVKKFEDVTDELEGIDIMVEACGAALRKDHAEIADDPELEDNLDMNAINQILRVAGGVDMSGDPNLPTTG